MTPAATALRYWNEVYVAADALAAIERDGELSDPGTWDAAIEGWGPGR